MTAKRKILLVAALLSAIFFFSCKKSNVTPKPNGNDDNNGTITPAIETLFSINFGKGVAKQGKHWPYYSKYTGDKGIEGILKDKVEIADKGVTVRTNSHASSGYEGASAGNNLYFSYKKDKKDDCYFEIKKLNPATHTAMQISFGANYYDFNSKDDGFKSEYVKVILTEAGNDTPQELKLTLKGEKGWVLLTSDKVTVKANTECTLKIVANNSIRIDDLKIVASNK